MNDERRTKKDLLEELHEYRSRTERAEAIIAGLGDGIIIQDTSYRIVYQNEINKKLYGDRKGEFCYRVFESIDHVCEWCPVKKTYEGGQIHSVLRKVSTPTGVRYYDLTSSPLTNSTGEIVAGIKIVRDVTRRELARQRLAEEKELSDALINSLPGHFFLVDAKGQLRRWNSKVELFTGYSAEEIAKMDSLDFFAGEEKGLVATKMQECLTEGEASVEASLVAKDGKKTPFLYKANRIEVGGEPMLAGLGVDISALKETEKKLAFSERYLSSIIRNEPECVKLMDPDGTVLAMNPAGLSMLEADNEDQIIGQSLLNHIDPKYCNAFADMSRKVCCGGKSWMEFQVVGMKGTRRWLETHSVPFEDETTGRTLILAVTRDITERKKAEKEIKEAKNSLELQNQELRKLDQMKDSLLRDVSHELKTPVAKHAMQLEILRPLIESLQLNEREANAFQVMRESIRRQEGVIRNLLDLARLEAGGREYDLKKVSLESIISKVKSDFQYALDAYGIEFEANVPPVSVLGDSEMLWHVFSNIINNAIKFHREDDPLRIAITAQAQDGEVLVQVSDNGIGLEETERQKLFTRFYQVSSANEGSGVGLAICRRIVEDQGGHINIDSEGLGKGVTVSVTLPLAGEDRVEAHD